MEKRAIELVVEQALGIAERLSQVTRAEGTPRAVSDLTEAEIVLLKVLAKQSGRSAGLRDVLRETGFSPSRLSKVIKTLESRKRLIRGQRAEGDRRRVNLMVLEPGLKALAEFKRVRKNRLHLVFQQLSPQDFKMVAEATALFSQALDKALGAGQPPQVGSVGAAGSSES